MMRTIIYSALILLILCTVPSALPTESFQWTDEDGVTHFANSLDDVPEKYRGQFQTHSPEDSPELKRSEEAAEGPSLKYFEVPCRAHEGSSRSVIISVTFNDLVTAPMALDTGSPGMVLSGKLAERLGLFPSDSADLFTEAAGIGSAQLAVLTLVDSVSVGEARDVFVPATVSFRMTGAFEGLIGMDFLTNYAISIDAQKQVVAFQETSPNPNSRGGHDEDWWRKTFREFRAARDRWEVQAVALDDSQAARKDFHFVEYQAREAEILLELLESLASFYGVPGDWR